MDENAHAKLDRLERQLTRVEDMLAKLVPQGVGLDLPPSATETPPIAATAVLEESPALLDGFDIEAPPSSTSGQFVPEHAGTHAMEPVLPAAPIETPVQTPVDSALEARGEALVEAPGEGPREPAAETPNQEENPVEVAAGVPGVDRAIVREAETTVVRPAAFEPRVAASRATTPSRGGQAKPDSVDWARLESLIAGRWYALVGALVVTIGVALFVQFAVKQGWLAQISVSARCMLGAALGFVLIAAGEWARRKVNDWASVGLTAGGLGAVYVSAYAAYALYRLLDPATALLLLAGVAGLGIAISALTSLSAVALVSLTGAYLAPIIASSGREGHVYVPAYWVALLTVGLVLSVRKGGNFVFCRALTTLATLGFGFGWCMEFAKDSPWIGAAFLGVAWVGVHAEMWYTAARADRQGSPEPYERDLSTLNEAEPLAIFRTMRLRSLASLTYTAWAVLLGLHVATESGALARSAAPGFGFAATLVLAGLIVGTHRVLNLRPVSRREVLAATLMCMSGTLLIATVAIALSGFAQAMTLCAVGLGALVASRLLRVRVLDLYGMLVLAFATLRIVLFDSWQLPSNAPAIELLGFHLTSWSASTAGVAVAWLAYAAAQIVLERVRPEDEGGMPVEFRLGSFIRLDRPEWRMIANFTLSLGILLLGVSLLHERAEQFALAAAAVTTALALALASHWRKSLPIAAFGGMLLMPAAVMTLLVDWYGWSVTSGSTPDAAVGLVLSFKMLCGWYYGLAAILIAWIYADQWGIARWFTRAIGLSGAAMLVLAVSHAQSETSSLCFAWIALCGVFTFASRHSRGLAFGAASPALWLFVMMAWIVSFVFNRWTDAPNAVLLYPGLWIGLGLAALCRFIAFSALVRREKLTPTRLLQTSWALCVLIVLVSTSLEVARTAGLLAVDPASRGAAVSVWWGVFAIGLLVIGFRRMDAHTRRAGLALLALGVAKALIFDLASVSPGWRSVSVVVLGLFMVGVGVVYAQISRRLAAAGPEPSTMET